MRDDNPRVFASALVRQPPSCRLHRGAPRLVTSGVCGVSVFLARENRATNVGARQCCFISKGWALNGFARKTVFSLAVALSVPGLATAALANIGSTGQPTGAAAGPGVVLVQAPQVSADRSCLHGLLPLCVSGTIRPALTLRVGPPRLPATASATVTQVQCPAQFAYCGTIPVPLDRKNPQNGTIPIAFELITHYQFNNVQSAIFVNFGGPGVGMTAPINTYSF